MLIAPRSLNRRFNRAFINVSSSTFNEKIWNYLSCTREYVDHVFLTDLISSPSSQNRKLDSWMHDSDVFVYHVCNKYGIIPIELSLDYVKKSRVQGRKITGSAEGIKKVMVIINII